MGIADFSLAGKKAVVMGGRKGLGKYYALTFAEAGADVAVADVIVDDGMLDSVGRLIQGYGRRAVTGQVDISKKADIEAFVKKVVAEFGTIDILANVGVRYVDSTLLNLNEEDWDSQTDINLKGYWMSCQAVAPIMIEHKKGSIINMTSQAGIKPQFPISTLGNYSIIKAAIIMLTRQLAVDLARHNVRVNAIGLSQMPFDPPPTDPALIEREKRTLAWMSSHTPMKRNAEHREVANGALFLASDASSYVTGHVLMVDGGFIL